MRRSAGPVRRSLTQRAASSAVKLDSIRHGLVEHQIRLSQRIALVRIFERDGARDDAAIDFRQRHIHGEIARIQAARAGPPRRLAAAREDDLQMRAIGDGCHGLGTGCGNGKGGRVKHDIGRRLGEELGQPLGRRLVLEARHPDRQHIEAVGCEGRDQRVDRRQIGRLVERAIEDECRDRQTLPPMRLRIAGARPIEAGMRKRYRLGRRVGAAEQRAGKPQEILGIGGPAFDQIAPEKMGDRRLDRAPAAKIGIRPIVAGQESHRDASRPAQRRQALDAVRPIGLAAQQPDDDEL